MVIVTLSIIYYQDTQRGIVSIQTGQVARQDLVQVVTASGEIAPKNYVNISANSASRITAATRQAVLTLPIQALTVRPLNALAKTEPLDYLRKGSYFKNGEWKVEGVFVVQNNQAIFEPISTGITSAAHIEVTRSFDINTEIITGSYKVLRTLKSRAKVRVENNKDSSSRWNR